MTNKYFKLIVVLTALFWTTHASASLIGDSVTHQRESFPASGPLIFDSQTKVINLGGTIFNAALHDVLVEGSSITLFGTAFGPSGFYAGSTLADQYSNIFDLDWVGEIGEIIGVEVSQTGDLGLFDGLAFNAATDVSFTADSVQVRLAGFRFALGSSIKIDLITDHTPVPEPGLLVLLSLGLLGLHRSRR